MSVFSSVIKMQCHFSMLRKLTSLFLHPFYSSVRHRGENRKPKPWTFHFKQGSFRHYWGVGRGKVHISITQQSTFNCPEEMGNKTLPSPLQFPSSLIHRTSKGINATWHTRTIPLSDPAGAEARQKACFPQPLYLVWSLVTFDLTLPSR